MMLVLIVVVVCIPGTCLPNTADLFLVAAGDFQDVQVDVDEDGEHREEENAEENNDAQIVNHGEEGTEAIITCLRLQLPHHNWEKKDELFFIYKYA